MVSSKAADSRASDRLPSDWKRLRARYSPATAANYDRVLKTLAALKCMSSDECERAAFVIIEKEEFRKLGIVGQDDD